IASDDRGYAIERRLVSAGALLLPGGLRRRFRRLPGGLLALLRPAAVDGLPQRLQEIDDVARGFLAFLALAEGLLDVQGLTLIDLGVDELPRLVLVVTGELRRGEVLGVGVDEFGRHLELLVRDLGPGVHSLEVDLADLIGPTQRLEHEQLSAYPQRRQAGADRKGVV